MKTMEVIAPCHFGLEAVLKREIYDLGYEITRVEDGRVTFLGDAEAICRGNIFLRTAERILIQVGRFPARSFEELFSGSRRCPGRNIFRKTGNSGLRRRLPSRVSCTAFPIYSPSLRKPWLSG